MISGINLSETVDFVLRSDKENPTTWKLGVVPNYLFAKISMNGTVDIETVYKVLQLGIKGWTNFDVPYETKKETICGRELEVVPIALLERVPIKYLTEISVEILRISQLSEVEQKNS